MSDRTAYLAANRRGPPSRAYLKLWEALTLFGCRPEPGETCLDLGASPGGWSWALQRMGARVVSRQGAARTRDRATARDQAPARERLRARQRAIGPVDWLFSDVVCYPERLSALVERWLTAGTCRRFICTIKFQGATDHETARRFAAIPGSQLRHLFHNKHELTWVKIG